MSDEFCDNCFKGVCYEGFPEGKIEQIAGIECYLGMSTGDYQKDKVVLFFPDAFGLPLLLVDDFARNGFRTVLQDYFEVWLKNHMDINIWKNVVDKIVGALQAEGVTWIATTGYCFGAPPAWYLALSNTTKVTAVSHPSRLKIPEDLEAYKTKSRAPLLINACEVDAAFPVGSQKAAEEVLGGGKFSPGFEQTYWDGCQHGFAVRGDMTNPKVKAGKEGAFEATVKFFRKHL